MTKNASDSPAPHSGTETQAGKPDRATAVHPRFSPCGGVDDLQPHPTVPVRQPAARLAADDGHLQHHEFRVGEPFWSSGKRWRCTDIGTRVITAIALDRDDDPSWYNGPPYAVAEVVFDEYDMEGCTSAPDPEDAVLLTTPDASVEAWDSPEGEARRRAQAAALRDQARAGGLRFEAYLPPRLADWLLAHIERGTFRDPSEAVFVMLGEQRELEPHADLRREFLTRRIQVGIDSGPGIPAEDVFERLRKSLEAPPPEPAVWPRQP